jgi:phage antirepressor YoqD-like protein
MNAPKVIEYNGVRVLTTVQLAGAYGSESIKIQQNFNNNKDRYKNGKHFILLHNEELKNFKRNLENFDVAQNINKLYLWTEKGAWLHAKSLNTDKAWEAYEMLVDEYYRLAEQFKAPSTYKEALLQLVEQIEKSERLELANAQKEQIINELQPKATYYDLVLQNKSLLSISKIAKDFGLSAVALNKILHLQGIQYKQGDCWLLYQKYADKGYTQSKTHAIDAELSKMHTYWTQKGRLFIYEILKTKKGILPIIERDLAS